MKQEQIEEEEYVYQHFEMTSQLYLDSLKLNINNSLDELGDTTKKSLDEEEGCDHVLLDVQNKFRAAVDGVMAMIEEPAKQFFSIPKNVLLPNPIKQYSQDEVNQLKTHSESLKEKYMKQQTYIALLEKEMDDFKEMDALQQNVDRLLQLNEENRANHVDMKVVVKDLNECINMKD